jgi:sulfate/thiosulfate-binding protein
MEMSVRRKFVLFLSMVGTLFASCLPRSPGGAGSGEITITLYGFSVMKEPLEKDIFPSFSSRWKQEHGQGVRFVSSFAGSETVTNQILQGVPADVAILSIERDVERLQQAGAVSADWKNQQHAGIVNETPFVILVRKGNPRNIKDFSDLAGPGLKIIHPDPVSSGGAQWSVLAIYGSELVKSERDKGARDEAAALTLLSSIWKNVISTPGSAREARTQFETGFGDALITYELEGLLMRASGAAIDIVVPAATIFSQHPAVMVDRNLTEARRPVVKAFLNYLWSDEAQLAFVRGHLRSVTSEALNKPNGGFAQIRLPFRVDYFGGWDRAYPEVIEGVWRDRVQRVKRTP